MQKKTIDCSRLKFLVSHAEGNSSALNLSGIPMSVLGVHDQTITFVSQNLPKAILRSEVTLQTISHLISPALVRPDSRSFRDC